MTVKAADVPKDQRSLTTTTKDSLDPGFQVEVGGFTTTTKGKCQFRERERERGDQSRCVTGFTGVELEARRFSWSRRVEKRLLSLF